MSRWDTPERLALRELVKDLTAKEIAPHVADWERDGLIPRALHKTFAAAGVLGVAFPEEVGGSGGDSVDAAIVTEEILLGGGSGGVVASLFTHGIALPHIAYAGSADLIDRYVRPTLSGDLIGALGITEPGGGSDVAGIRTTARRDGDHYIVNGAKTYITSGIRADFVTTAVRTGEQGYGGISLLVIDKGLAGFTVSPPLDKMGWRASDTAELSFQDVRVPAGNLVGAEGDGFVLIMRQFQTERLALATQAWAMAQRALDLTMVWVKDRETFGRPLSSRQVVRHRLVEMHRQVEVARAYVHAVAARHVGGEDVTAEACLAKQTAVDCATYVCDRAVQLHGGTGYMHGTEVERHYRDARILPIGGGADEVLRDLTAKLLGYS